MPSSRDVEAEVAEHVRAVGRAAVGGVLGPYEPAADPVDVEGGVLRHVSAMKFIAGTFKQPVTQVCCAARTTAELHPQIRSSACTQISASRRMSFALALHGNVVSITELFMCFHHRKFGDIAAYRSCVPGDALLC